MKCSHPLSFREHERRTAVLDGTCCTPTTAFAAGQAADEGVEDGGDAADNGVEDAGDGIDDGGQAGADCGEDAADLERVVLVKSRSAVDECRGRTQEATAPILAVGDSPIAFRLWMM